MNRYITWTCCIVCEPHKNHPNTNLRWAENESWILTETWYTDWTLLYIGVLDSEIVPETMFNIVEKTESEIQALLDTWYSWEVIASNYQFTDNRPDDTL